MDQRGEQQSPSWSASMYAEAIGDRQRCRHHFCVRGSAIVEGRGSVLTRPEGLRTTSAERRRCRRAAGLGRGGTLGKSPGSVQGKIHVSNGS